MRLFYVFVKLCVTFVLFFYALVCVLFCVCVTFVLRVYVCLTFLVFLCFVFVVVKDVFKVVLMFFRFVFVFCLRAVLRFLLRFVGVPRCLLFYGCVVFAVCVHVLFYVCLAFVYVCFTCGLRVFNVCFTFCVTFLPV